MKINWQSHHEGEGKNFLIKNVFLLLGLWSLIPSADAHVFPLAFWRSNCAGCANGYSVGYKLTFNAHPSANLSNFPNLVSGTYANLADVAHGGTVQHSVTLNGQTVPADLIFTSDASGKLLLSWEIEYWNNVTGAIVAWVSFSRSSSSDDVIYMWGGKSTVTTYQSAASATWDSSFAGVWHFPNGTTLSAYDSTSNGNNGTVSGITAAAGKMSGGASNTSSSGVVNVGSGSSLNITAQPLTISAWVYLNSYGVNSKAYIFDETGSTAPIYSFFADNVSVSNGLAFYVNPTGTLSSANVIATGAWYNVAVTYTSNTVTFYVNGAPVTSNSFSLTFPSGSTGGLIGNDVTSARNFNGILDEVRVSSVARSAAWIAHDYAQQSQSSSWYAVTSL